MEAYDLKWNGMKINSFNYLRVLAMFMILYDHLGCLRNQEWMIKKAFVSLPKKPAGVS